MSLALRLDICKHTNAQSINNAYLLRGFPCSTASSSSESLATDDDKNACINENEILYLTC